MTLKTIFVAMAALCSLTVSAEQTTISFNFGNKSDKAKTYLLSANGDETVVSSVRANTNFRDIRFESSCGDAFVRTELDLVYNYDEDRFEFKKNKTFDVVAPKGYYITSLSVNWGYSKGGSLNLPDYEDLAAITNVSGRYLWMLPEGAPTVTVRNSGSAAMITGFVMVLEPSDVPEESLKPTVVVSGYDGNRLFYPDCEISAMAAPDAKVYYSVNWTADSKATPDLSNPAQAWNLIDGNLTVTDSGCYAFVASESGKALSEVVAIDLEKIEPETFPALASLYLAEQTEKPVVIEEELVVVGCFGEYLYLADNSNGLLVYNPNGWSNIYSRGDVISDFLFKYNKEEGPAIANPEGYEFTYRQPVSTVEVAAPDYSTEVKDTIDTYGLTDLSRCIAIRKVSPDNEGKIIVAGSEMTVENLPGVGAPALDTNICWSVTGFPMLRGENCYFMLMDAAQTEVPAITLQNEIDPTTHVNCISWNATDFPYEDITVYFSKVCGKDVTKDTPVADPEPAKAVGKDSFSVGVNDMYEDNKTYEWPLEAMIFDKPTNLKAIATAEGCINSPIVSIFAEGTIVVSGIEELQNAEYSEIREFYTLSGTPVKTENLNRGIYVVTMSDNTSKVLIIR